jgi:outer membrane lipoprotein-sorting protein
MKHSSFCRAAGLLAVGQLADAAALDKLKAVRRGTKRRADFVQSGAAKNGPQAAESSGGVDVLAPGKFRWTYESPTSN